MLQFLFLIVLFTAALFAESYLKLSVYHTTELFSLKIRLFFNSFIYSLPSSLTIPRSASCRQVILSFLLKLETANDKYQTRSVKKDVSMKDKMAYFHSMQFYQLQTHMKLSFSLKVVIRKDAALFILTS